MNKKLFSVLIFVFLACPAIAVVHAQANTTANTALPGTTVPSTLTETLGAFIIIAGERPDHNLQGLIVGGADKAYNILRDDLGFPASSIYYLCPEFPHWDANASSTYTDIQHAIDTWAAGKVDSTHGLGLYLFDHGGEDVMGIVGGVLNDTELNGMLNSL